MPLPQRNLDIPSLTDVKHALAQLDTLDALVHLEKARSALDGLTARLQQGGRPGPAEQGQLECALLRLQTELRQAGALAEQGLAFCQEWTDLLLPVPGYQYDGAGTAGPFRSELSLKA